MNVMEEGRGKQEKMTKSQLKKPKWKGSFRKNAKGQKETTKLKIKQIDWKY